MQTIANHPRIKSHFSIVAHSADHIELRSGVWNPLSYLLTDETQQGYLLPLINALNGKQSILEIATNLSIPIDEVKKIIDYLLKLNVLTDKPDSAFDFVQYTTLLQASNPTKSIKVPPLLIAGDQELAMQLQRLLNATYPGEMTLLPEQHAELQLLEQSDAEWLTNGIEFEKMALQFIHWSGHLLVYLQKNIHPTFTIKLNRILHDLKIPWIHAGLDGPFLMVGPTFTAETACYECFETRVALNLKDHASYQKYKMALSLQKVTHLENKLDPILKNLLVSHTALEVMNFALTSCTFTQNKVLSLYLPTMEINFNEFLRKPACPACGVHPLRDGHALYFDIAPLLEATV